MKMCQKVFEYKKTLYFEAKIRLFRHALKVSFTPPRVVLSAKFAKLAHFRPRYTLSPIPRLLKKKKNFSDFGPDLGSDWTYILTQKSDLGGSQKSYSKMYLTRLIKAQLVE